MNTTRESGNVVWDGRKDGHKNRRQYPSAPMVAESKNKTFGDSAINYEHDSDLSRYLRCVLS